MAIDYTTARTEFVKNAIKNATWKDRDRIKDLMDVEDMFFTPTQGMGHAMKRTSLKNEYREEYRAIKRELHPISKEDEARIERDKIEAARRKEARKESILLELFQEQERERQSFIAAGGKT